MKASIPRSASSSSHCLEKKTGPLYPAFSRKASNAPLWLNNPYKPPWVDPRVPALASPTGQVTGSEIQTLCETGQLNRALDVLFHGAAPLDTHVYVHILKACERAKSPCRALWVYAHICQNVPDLGDLLTHQLVFALSKCGAADDAHHVFLSLPNRTAFLWTTIILGYADCSRGREALEAYSCMQEDGAEPNTYTFVGLFRACGSIPDPEKAAKLHNDAQGYGFASNVYVGSTLINMYGKFGNVAKAECVFDRLAQRNDVSWNAMLSAYIEQGYEKKALRLYRQMLEEGLTSNQQTFMIVLQACWAIVEEEKISGEERATKPLLLHIGKALHADSRRKGLASDICVGSALVSMYGKCQHTVEAESVFSSLLEQNVVSWSAMISAYVEGGQGDKALLLYRQMLVEGLISNTLTFVGALQACGILGETRDGEPLKVAAMEISEAFRVDAHGKGFISDAYIGSALLSMYCRWGSLSEAENVFDFLSHESDIVLWNAMLSTYVELGRDEKVLELYKRMQDNGMLLDDISMICALQACSEAGSLEICMQVHFNVIFVGYEDRVQLSNTLIHAYGSCSSMEDVLNIFDGLSQPPLMSWNACIGGYAQIANMVGCLEMFEEMRLIGVMPNEVTFLSVLCACSHASLVSEALMYFNSMIRDYGIAPEVKYYVVMVDLLGRAGDFQSLEDVMVGMPIQADLEVWLTLLAACRLHGNVEVGRWAFDHAVAVQPKDAAAYVAMSNIYADAGMIDCANEVQNLIQIQGAWMSVGA